MKVAVPCYSGFVFQHFGRSAEFMIYEVDDKKEITKTEELSTEGRTHGALAEWLKGLGVDTVICGGIGPGMQMFLQKQGIRYYGGVTGKCDACVKALLEDTLSYDPEMSWDETGRPKEEEESPDGGTFHMPIIF